MANTTVTISGVMTGLENGSHQISITVTTAVGLPDSVNLASGFNTISLPSGMLNCIFTPPSGNSQTLTFKGVTGDTGRALAKTGPNLLRFDSGVTDFGITAGGTVTGVQLLFF